MSAYSIHQGGRIVRYISGNELILELNTREGEGAIEGRYDPDMYFIEDGEAVPRLPVYAAQSLSAEKGEALTIPDLPEGTAVIVDGETVGQIDATNTLDIAFSMAGVWPVRLEPPFPWLPAEFEVTVT